MSATEYSLLECGVDYITVTATQQPQITSLVNVAKENLEAEARAGNEVKDWRGQFYVGQYAGSASFGVGPQGALARLSSGVAKMNWSTLFSSGMKCTRLDLQATIKGSSAPSELVGKCWNLVLDHWQNQRQEKKPKLVSGPYGPESIYLGSRQSERYGRIYDKFAESKLDHYTQSVRFEVEYKGKSAHRLASRLCAMPHRFTDVTTPLQVYFEKRGLSPWLTDVGQVFAGTCGRCSIKARYNCIGSNCSGELPGAQDLPRSSSDAERKLRYLSKSIRPMVSLLVRHYGREAVLQALGLPEETLTAESEH